jgi:uncharacterized tellurite resistance protein B-like protein
MTDDRDIAHLRDVIDERDRRYEQRYEASQKALDAALSSADRAVQAALLAAKEAVLKAELSADKRFELLNELRTGIATSDQLEALEKVVTELAKRADQLAGATLGRSGLLSIILGIVGAIGVVVSIWFATH